LAKIRKKKVVAQPLCLDMIFHVTWNPCNIPNVYRILMIPPHHSPWISETCQVPTEPGSEVRWVNLGWVNFYPIGISLCQTTLTLKDNRVTYGNIINQLHVAIVY
jgi:hypothetical protein